MEYFASLLSDVRVLLLLLCIYFLSKQKINLNISFFIVNVTILKFDDLQSNQQQTKKRS